MMVPGRTTYHYSNHRHDDDIQTLGGSNGHHGGFGAISFKASEFNNKDIIMAVSEAGGSSIAQWRSVSKVMVLSQLLNTKYRSEQFLEEQVGGWLRWYVSGADYTV
jgi:hypothetical protein